MTAKDKDFVLLDYTGSTNGVVFDTSIGKVAKDKGIYRENRVYKPLVVAVGMGDVIAGLDKELPGMKKDEKKKVKVSPEDGYGKRDPKEIVLIPLKKLQNNKINPFPGMLLTIETEQGPKHGRVQSVSGGRVRVDFNHELAGKELDFEIKVVDVLTKPKEKAQALADQYFDKNQLKIELKDKKVIATPNKELLTTKAYAQAKAYFISQVTGKIEGYSVEFIEEYKKA